HYFQYIPEPFDPEQVIDWTPVWSLTEKRSKWLPTAYCYHGYSGSRCNEVHLNQLSRLDRFFPRRFYCTS
ncbi:MAG: YcaO-like family protein, partial [Symploca sp. SIO3E6]|nr:YcaO-like family protein [Caldora sp. SIO3E6]